MVILGWVERLQRLDSRILGLAMYAEPQPETRWNELPIVCPFCGNHSEAKGRWSTNAAVPFKLVEEVVRSFEFSAELDDERRLLIDADVETDEVDWESGNGIRIECMACFGQFPIPEGADIDFV